MEALISLCTWLVRASVQAAVLAVVVLVVQWLFRRSLTPRWRCALWWLVLARLALPVSLESAASIFNLAKFAPEVPIISRSVPEERGLRSPAAPTTAVEVDSSSSERPPPALPTPPPTGPDLDLITEGLGGAFAWTTALALVWLLGALSLAGRILWESRRWRVRLHQQTNAADASLYLLLEECRQLMRVRTPVTLEETAVVESPALYGWRRPRLLLPQGLATRITREELRFIILHELAHARRGDIGLNWLLAALQILHWFNPVVWLTFARLRADRELACDALALECVGEEERRPYGETILKLLAAGPLPVRLPGLTGIIEDRGAVKRRIRMIADFKRPSRWSWLAGLLVAGLAWVTLTDARSPKSMANVSETASETAPHRARVPDPATASNVAAPSWLDTMEVLALHRETRAPVAGVALEVRMDGKTNTYTTDAMGMARIALPQERPRSMSVETRKDGFLHSYTHWFLAERAANLPPRYTVPLDPGVVVGGVVRGDSGKPLAGVEIKGDHGGPGDEESPAIVGFPAANITKFFRWGDPVVTDAKGRWQMRIELEEANSLYLELQHPQHIPKHVEVRGVTKTLEPLRAEKFETVLESGLAVTGRVLDTAGRPITNAVVRHGLVLVSDSVTAGTDAEGRFTFDQHFPAGQFELIVQSPEHAPEKRQLVLKRGLAPVEFRLGPGHTLRVRVVDGVGRPVAKTTMRLASWQASPNEPPGGPSDLDLVAETDANGQFEWHGAPLDAVKFDIFHPDFHEQRNVPLRPGPEELTVKLHAALVISGRITDSVTGRPVPRFTVVQGDASERFVKGKLATVPFWDPFRRPNFHDGAYEMRISSAVVQGLDHQPDQMLRIEAEGYMPAISRYYKPDEGRQTWDVKLAPAANLTGSIRGTNGQPLAGVTILVQNGACVPRMEAGRLGSGQSWDGLKLFSDREGKYSLPSEPTDWPVYFVHDQGWLETSLHRHAKHPDFTLPAWGRVEGVWQAGGKPSKNEPVELVTDMKENGPTFSFNTKADAQGRFRFDQVPPGETHLGVRVNLTANSWTTRRVGEPFVVKAGETTHVTNAAATKGRAVIGRFVAGPGMPGKLVWTDSTVELERQNPNRKPPPSPSGLSKKQRNDWIREWFETDAGKAYQKENQREHQSFQVKVAASGTFRAEGLPPGFYLLQGSFWRRLLKGGEVADEDEQGDRDILADVLKDFTVPPLTDGQGSKPLDLGNLTATPNKGLLVGRPAPPFVIPTLAGKDFSLAEQRGRYVVLHFWSGSESSWVSRQFAAMKAMHDAMGSRTNVVLLSVALNGDEDGESVTEARQYLTAMKPAWPQAVPGGWETVGSLGIRSSPICYLIGPDGAVLAKKANPEQLREKLAQAIGGN